MNNNRFTFYGICQYDSSITDGIILPEPLDSKYLIDLIMQRSGDLYVYQQSPSHLKQNITNWFARNFNNIKRQVEALNSEYNPIENYDRYEEWKDTMNHSGKDHSTSKGSSEAKASAFNSSDYENASLATDENSVTNEYGSNNDGKHIGHIHGNIGVTTASAMIAETIQLYSMDLYENIAQRFEKEFLVQVY